MGKHKILWGIIFPVLLLIAAVAFAESTTHYSNPTKLPGVHHVAIPEGKMLVQQYCTRCHNLQRVKSNIGKLSQQDWVSYITRMQKNGSTISDSQKQTVASYLSSLSSPKEF